MTPLHVFRWFMAAAIAALLSATVQPAAADRMGGGHGGMGVRGGMGIRGGMGMAPHSFSGRGSGHAFGHFDHRNDFAFRSHDDRFRDRDFDRDDRFFHHDRFFDFDRDDRFFFRDHRDRFFFFFDFAAFGFPVGFPVFPVGFTGWYPGYADDSSYSGNGPVYDRQYWADLAVSVQSELAQRGYYHGVIDGEIGSGSSQAIRAFQAAQGLPVTGKIDPKLLNALGIKYKTA